jgi:hypothetical protein
MPDPDTLSPLHALHRLRDVQVSLLAQTIAGFAGTWTLERHEGYDGDLTVLLVSARRDDATYVISRSAHGFHLGANLGDEFRPIGVFVSPGELMSKLRMLQPAAPTANRTA